MLSVCRDALPDSYLLVVASDDQTFDAHALDRALHRAGRSGKQAVWLDCSLLAPRDVTPEMGLLLCAYAEVFAAQGIVLVVAHAGAALQLSLAAAGSDAGPRLVGSLVDPPPFEQPTAGDAPSPISSLDPPAASPPPRRRRAAGVRRLRGPAPDARSALGS
ncbi:MAG TPA: hypothetical protein VF630_02790 [Hymenobacter sp.]